MDREQVNWLAVSQKGPLFNCLGYNSLGFGATIVAEKEEKVLVLPCGLQVIGYFMLMPVFLSAEITEERKVQRSRRLSCSGDYYTLNGLPVRRIMLWAPSPLGAPWCN
jgi:hypothetical protein